MTFPLYEYTFFSFIIKIIPMNTHFFTYHKNYLNTHFFIYHKNYMTFSFYEYTFFSFYKPNSIFKTVGAFCGKFFLKTRPRTKKLYSAK